jgi:hypothetical protein
MEIRFIQKRFIKQMHCNSLLFIGSQLEIVIEHDQWHLDVYYVLSPIQMNEESNLRNSLFAFIEDFTGKSIGYITDHEFRYLTDAQNAALKSPYDATHFRRDQTHNK